MTGGYRGPLEAALARLEQLERENAQLRERVTGSPPSPQDLEAARIANEIVHLDIAWVAASERGNWATDEKTRRLNLRARYVVVVLVLGFATWALRKPQGPFISAFLVFVAAAFLAQAIFERRRSTRQHAEYAAKRKQLTDRLAALEANHAVFGNDIVNGIRRE